MPPDPTSHPRRRARPILLAAAFAALLGACAETPPPDVFPELTYGHLAPIRLAVERVEIASTFEPSFTDPDVEHLFPTPPQRAAERWALDRLTAAGGDGRRAIFIVRVARVAETALSGTGGLAGLFTTDQEARYDATLEVELEIRDVAGQRLAFATARVLRTLSVPEGITLDERESIWLGLTEALVRDMGTELEKTIAKYLGAYLAG
jgi:hypothetical protein